MNFDQDQPPSIFQNAESLQMICLKLISRGLDECILAAKTGDMYLQKSVQMLQRFYSSNLLEVMSGARLLQDRHLGFLLNEHLTEIDFRFLAACSPEAVIQRFAEVGYAFKNVNFRFEYLGTKSMKKKIDFVNQFVIHLTNVTTLRLYGQYRETTLKLIADSCPKLEELYFGYFPKSSGGLLSLCRKRDNVFEAKCSNLRILRELNYRDDDAVKFLLKHIPTLEEIGYYTLPELMWESLQEISNAGHMRKFNLTTLTLNMCSIDCMSIKEEFTLISNLCPRLKTLVAYCLREHHLEAVSRFVGIEYLTIFSQMHRSFIGVTTLDCNNLLKTMGSGLKELHLILASFSVSVLVQNCTNLERLNLVSPQFQLTPDDQNSAVMSKLVELHVEKFYHFNDATRMSVHQIFDSCPNLERLYVKRCYFSDWSILLTLLKESSLTFLFLKRCKIQMDLLEDIIKNTPSLETLCIEDRGYDEKSMQNLGEISKTLDNFVNICWNEY